MQVTNRPNIFLDQGQFSNPDLSAAHIKGKMSNLQINKLISSFIGVWGYKQAQSD
jgi:hypothetical protein